MRIREKYILRGVFILKFVGYMYCWGLFMSYKVSGKIWSQMKYLNINLMLFYVNVYKLVMQFFSWVLMFQLGVFFVQLGFLMYIYILKQNKYEWRYYVVCIVSLLLNFFKKL